MRETIDALTLLTGIIAISGVLSLPIFILFYSWELYRWKRRHRHSNYTPSWTRGLGDPNSKLRVRGRPGRWRVL